jgi:acyl-CoA synthetase (NDP forming)
VALKALGRAHKSDGGGVAIGLADAGDLARAYAAMPPASSYSVEENVDSRGGVEMIVGGRRDRVFGPVVVVGAGGVLAELLEDSVVAPALVGLDEAREMVGRLRIAQLLRGYRHQPARDIDALADVIVAVGQAIADTPAVEALELNPVLVRARGAVALDCHWENVS